MATNGIHGRFGALYCDQSAGANGSAAPLGNLSDWTISGTREQVTATVLGETNITYLSGLQDFSGSLSGLIDTTTNGLFVTGDGVARSFYLYIDNTDASSRAPIAGGGKGYWYGKALFNGVSTSAGVGDAVKWTMDWSASGSITKV